MQQSEHLKSAINALLSRTGQPTRKFMLVMATNRPQDLDSAVLDRIDDSIAFPLPSHEERVALLDLYFRKYIRLPCQPGCHLRLDHRTLPAAVCQGASCAV